ncbi:hypothetical protein TPHA_0K02360 [Tetrapisispora phaffii CBS 4417]|uniref:Uncharacterized protein n=1 Tax=Tetrapisispora phaffii (strain ATCC 24235 / CBS 4417 / NBRC 1672 / NRRL Y-8282 / UCD 70-5) TaxID=1071381 RepID=G8BZN8_TETPH|nr:hypothetical protein TPHA_0K02360 [Tetrapisispora phaffii CBS 4417]CCE65366.1 hypothetical protein TPHA_0K02360 [Tetrapisispora phaffii CBS 4417]
MQNKRILSENSASGSIGSSTGRSLNHSQHLSTVNPWAEEDAVGIDLTDITYDASRETEGPSSHNENGVAEAIPDATSNEQFTIAENYEEFLDRQIILLKTKVANTDTENTSSSPSGWQRKKIERKQKPFVLKFYYFETRMLSISGLKNWNEPLRIEKLKIWESNGKAVAFAPHLSRKIKYGNDPLFQIICQDSNNDNFAKLITILFAFVHTINRHIESLEDRLFNLRNANSGKWLIFLRTFQNFIILQNNISNLNKVIEENFLIWAKILQLENFKIERHHLNSSWYTQINNRLEYQKRRVDTLNKNLETLRKKFKSNSLYIPFFGIKHYPSSVGLLTTFITMLSVYS